MSRARKNRGAAQAAAAPKWWRRWLSIEALLWLGVLVLLAYRVAPQAKAALGVSSDGTSAPAVTMQMLDGSYTTLEQLRGKVVLVNFWATWCPPCRFEMPGFQKVYDAQKAKGFTIIGLSADEGSREHVVGFLKQRGITYPVGMATDNTLTAFGGVNAFPTSFLIDRKGRIRYRVSGIFAEVALREAVERLLAEPS